MESKVGAPAALSSENPHGVPVSDNDRRLAAEITQRINERHRTALYDCLCELNNIPPKDALTANLSSFTCEQLVVEYESSDGPSKQTAIVKFSPSLVSLNEAESRLIEMARLTEGASFKGQPPPGTTVSRYVPPSGPAALIFVGCLLTYVLTFKDSNFQSGSRVYDLVFSNKYFTFPDNAFAILRTYRPQIFWGLLGIHSVEAAALARTRLARYNVPFLSPVWLLWVFSNLIEGFTVFDRIDREAWTQARKSR